jgi:hypothetical protein
MAALVELAPAKVNLTLTVLGRRADGYHLLDSLVVFAGVADRLTLAPGPALSLKVRGETAREAGPLDDNLVLKAARALAAQVPDLKLGRFRSPRGLAADRRTPVPRFACWPGPTGFGQPARLLRKLPPRSGPTCRFASIRGRGACEASARCCRHH